MTAWACGGPVPEVDGHDDHVLVRLDNGYVIPNALVERLGDPDVLRRINDNPRTS